MALSTKSIEILVVDDSAMERLLVSQVLRQDPVFRITAVTDGWEAMDFARSRRPDVVVTDLRMPGMNGLQLIENLQSCGHTMPVVLMTSYGSEKLVVQALKAGAASYVPKLNLESSLVKTINRVLSMTAQRRFQQPMVDELTISEWCFALENDPASVPHLISHLLDLVVQLNVAGGARAAKICRTLKRVLSDATVTGTLEIDGELRGLLNCMPLEPGSEFVAVS